MQRRTINQQCLLAVMLFIICPALSFPVILYYGVCRKYWAYTMLAVFMGLCAMLWPPTGDLYRHTMDSFAFRELSVREFSYYMEVRGESRFDFLLPLLSFLFAKAGIPFEFVRFLFIFIAYMLTFRVFEDCIRKNPGIGKMGSTVFFIFFCSIQFFTIVMGLRFGFAVILLAYGAWQYLEERKLAGLLYIALSCMVHFSVIPVAMLLFLARFGVRINNFWISLLCVGAVLCLNPTVFQRVIDILPVSDGEKMIMSGYVSGYWSDEFLEDHSLKFQIAKYLSFLMMFPLLYFAFRNRSDRPFCSFVRLLIPVVFICYAVSVTMFFRIGLLCVSMGAFLFFSDSTVNSPFRIRLLLICACLSFASQVYAFRREAAISHEYMLFYPAPVGFSSTFSGQWIDRHVYDSGDIRNK